MLFEKTKVKGESAIHHKFTTMAVMAAYMNPFYMKKVRGYFRYKF
jgi:hypothetical protein